MARATSSLPVPLSPWIEHGGRAVRHLLHERHQPAEGGAGADHVALPQQVVEALLQRAVLRRSAIAALEGLATTLVSWARWNGLVRKSEAPSFIALTASSTVPKAVSRITSTSGATALACPEQLEAGQARHLEVGEHEVDAALPAAARARPGRRGRARPRSPRGSACARGSGAPPGSSSATSSVARRLRHQLMGRSLDGHGHGEGRARAGRAVPADLAAVLLDDLARDGEAEARCPAAWW